MQPAIFIHMDDIRSVDFARAGGASSTFDFQVHLKNKAIEEFSNISRHELSCLQEWVSKLKLPVGFPSYSEEEDNEEEQASEEEEEEEEDSDADDDDFDPYAHRTKKKQRKASEDEGDKEEDEEEDWSSDDEDDEDDGVELVSEEDFKIESLQKMIAEEKKDVV